MCLAGAYAHGLAGSLIAPAGYNGVDLQPLAVAAPALSKPALPKQGFMALQVACAAGAAGVPRAAAAAGRLQPGQALSFRLAPGAAAEAPAHRPLS